MSVEIRKPLYKKGDLVFFDFDNGEQLIQCKGIVQVVDVMRTEIEIRSIEYDIYGDDYLNPGTNCLYKHIDEKYINPITGEMIIISGFSGVGKGTIIDRLLKNYQEKYMLSVSHTTRKPRKGETDGKTYSFISRIEFEKKIETDSYLEYAIYAGEYYGTPKDEVYRNCFDGKKVILEIEPQGALEIKRLHPGVKSIFIIPPSFEELLIRLVGRGSETNESIRHRMWQSLREMEHLDLYDVIWVNHNPNDVAYFINLLCDSKSYELKEFNKLRLEDIENLKKGIIKYLYQSRESDFEVKLLVNPKLSEEKRQFIDDVISNYMHKYDICIHSDGITYSKNKPHRKWADLPAGFEFYNSLYKYNEYFAFLEYYSYLEGDFNGTVYRDTINNDK